MSDPIVKIASKFQVPPVEQEQMLASGNGTVIYSRVIWAKTYLKQAGLIESPKRGVFRLSQEGTVLRKFSRGPGFEYSSSRESHVDSSNEGVQIKRFLQIPKCACISRVLSYLGARRDDQNGDTVVQAMKFFGDLFAMQ